MDSQRLEYNLLISETSLAYVPKEKFQLNSWIIFDEFMEYATCVFTTILAGLIKEGYLEILIEEKRSRRLLGIPFSTRTVYFIKLVSKPSKELVVGWLEEKVLEQFKHSDYHKLKTVVYQTLNEIFESDRDLTNPGKVLVFNILRNQKLNLYDFQQRKNWLSNRIGISVNQELGKQLKPTVYKLEDFTLSNVDIRVLKQIVSRELNKFQNLG